MHKRTSKMSRVYSNCVIHSWCAGKWGLNIQRNSCTWSVPFCTLKCRSILNPVCWHTKLTELLMLWIQAKPNYMGFILSLLWYIAHIVACTVAYPTQPLIPSMDKCEGYVRKVIRHKKNLCWNQKYRLIDPLSRPWTGSSWSITTT